ncbi:hypothetical protein B0H17DRAFT_1216557 [Mycena rosella]|uniref:Uncharacterized protein n=1 Tax=Mycena rosella TaxID=1033263 RepID=A0AAD7FW16_MYCRO|nr:hypothetical protein B0H17DRAFT_1216557 [Mycena rosella]
MPSRSAPRHTEGSERRRRSRSSRSSRKKPREEEDARLSAAAGASRIIKTKKLGAGSTGAGGGPNIFSVLSSSSRSFSVPVLFASPYFALAPSPSFASLLSPAPLPRPPLSSSARVPAAARRSGRLERSVEQDGRASALPTLPLPSPRAFVFQPPLVVLDEDELRSWSGRAVELRAGWTRGGWA